MYDLVRPYRLVYRLTHWKPATWPEYLTTLQCFPMQLVSPKDHGFSTPLLRATEEPVTNLSTKHLESLYPVPSLLRL